MNNRNHGLEPRSEVLHLPTLFRRVGDGEVRIPAFQRGLVWDKEQIRALLESVYRGYPIGSLLLWNVAAQTFEPYVPEAVSMPSDAGTGTLAYVLDGMQRLITLYATFNGGGGPERRFDICFDLEQRRFFHIGARDRLPITRLRLSRVFVPREFIDDQAELAKLSDADQLLSTAIDLHSRFQGYALPVITIVRATTSEAVKIFMNINRGGSDLSTVDFMRALTWHNDFDLNRAVDRIKDSLPRTFRPDDETIAKIVALVLDIDPIPDTILQLQELSPSALESGVQRAATALQRTAEFLREQLCVASADFVPYEGQMLVLAGIFDRAPISAATGRKLREWFIASSFSEAFQGRPDHYIIRLVRETVDAVSGGRFNLDRSLDMDPTDLARKQLTKGTAISTGFIVLLAQRRARSIFSGEVIDPTQYLAAFDSSNLAPIITEVGGARGARRRLMNQLLLSTVDSYDDHGDLLRVLDGCSADVLDSQLLTRDMIDMVRENDFEGFVTHRAALTWQVLQEFLQ